jgi:hypothetical protein
MGKESYRKNYIFNDSYNLHNKISKSLILKALAILRETLVFLDRHYETFTHILKQ